MSLEKKLSISSLAVFLTCSIVIFTSWVTRHVVLGGDRFPVWINALILQTADIPTKVKGVVGLINMSNQLEGSQDLYSGFDPGNSEKKALSGYLLISQLSNTRDQEVFIVNVSNRVRKNIKINWNQRSDDKYSDKLTDSEMWRKSEHSSLKRVWHPYLKEDGSLIFALPWNDIISLNSDTGEVKWKIRGAFHHSIEPDCDGNFWACASTHPNLQDSNGRKLIGEKARFEDQAIVHFSPNGKIIKVFSVANILCRSGLEYLLFGVSNPNLILDPIHLNQITPILSDRGAFKKGCILVSLRNLSTILLFDPMSQKLIWHGTGPWMNQHSVAVSGDSEFSVLDNHSFASGDYWVDPNWSTRILEHNIESNQTREVSFNQKSPHRFRIPIDGRAFKIENGGWLLEDPMAGTVMIFQDQELVFKWSNKYYKNTVGITSWCRFIPAAPVSPNTVHGKIDFR